MSMPATALPFLFIDDISLDLELHAWTEGHWFGEIPAVVVLEHFISLLNFSFHLNCFQYVNIV